VGLTWGSLASVSFPGLRSVPKAWALAAAAALLFVAGVEVALRRWFPLEAGAWGELPALQAHPTRGYALKPNRLTRLRYNNYDYVLRTNSLGLASPDVTPARESADVFRVLLVGDAFTMPEGLPYERSYGALLEQKLKRCLAPRQVQVINAGVTGYGPAEQLPQLEELAPLLRPDVTLYQFFINEFGEVHLTHQERAQRIGLATAGRSRRDAALGRLQLLAHLRALGDRLRETVTGQPSPTRSSKALLEFYRAGRNPVYADSTLDAIREHLQGMHTVASTVGTRLIILFVPGAVAVSRPDEIDYFPWDQDLTDSAHYDLDRPLRELRRVADPLGIPVVDLTPDLRGWPQQPVYYSASWHWNDAGHQAVARAASAALVKDGVVDRSCTE
jgi:hypothetical protein